MSELRDPRRLLAALVILSIGLSIAASTSLVRALSEHAALGSSAS